MPKMPRPGAKSPVGFRPPGQNAASPRVQLATAAAHHAAGRLREAEMGYRAILASQPNSRDALLGMASLAMAGGHAEGCLSFAQRSIGQPPKDKAKDAQAQLLCAQALGALGRLGEALQAVDQALQAKPRFPEAWLAKAVVLSRQGEIDQAEKALETAIRQKKDYAEALFNLGSLQFNQARPAEAVRQFEKVTRLAPAHGPGWVGLGQALFADGRAADAIAPLVKARKLHPGLAALASCLGRCYNALGAFGLSQDAHRDAVAIGREDPAILNDAGAFATENNRFEDGIDLALRAIQTQESLDNRQLGVASAPGEVHLQAARAMIQGGQISEAIAFLTHLLEAHPDWARARRLLADAHKRSGSFDAARAAYEQAAADDPEDAAILSGLVETYKIAPEDPILARLEGLLARPDWPEEDRIELLYALGKALEDSKDHEAAFARIAEANALQAARNPFDPEAHDAFIDRLIARFDSAFFAAQSGLGMPDDVKTSEVPVLVVGLPRSGTTLVEQIIASHSRAAGAGELTHFARLEKEAIHLGTGGVLSGLVYPDQADRLDPAALADRARGYLDHLEKIGNGALRVVDKLPANYLRIGLFARLFPRGRIVHTRRSLMDSCLSIYFKNFNASHPYAHDLTHLGRYARSYERLMDHWRKTCPIEILDVDYADMVQDQAGQSKRLLAYLGLPWEDGVLDFHQTDRQVVTASAWQVRRPIYRDALDRSARYGSGPDPLRQALAG